MSTIDALMAVVAEQEQRLAALTAERDTHAKWEEFYRGQAEKNGNDFNAVCNERDALAAKVERLTDSLVRIRVLSNYHDFDPEWIKVWNVAEAALEATP